MFFRRRKKAPGTDELATVQSQRNDLTAEEFPEGPYGSSLNVESLGKSSPWLTGQHGANPFSYENHQLHEGLPRVYPGQDRQYLEDLWVDEEREQEE